MTTTVHRPSETILRSGDRLDSAEFLRRWELLPHVRHAELIDGKVFIMSSPVSTQHGQPHARLMGWLSYYEALTPGIELYDNVTLVLDEANTVQPDALLKLPTRAGGAVRATESDYLTGPAEFVAEVAYSSRNIDLHDKRDAYQRAGVKEYLVWRTTDHAIDWWVNGPHGFQPIEPDTDGVRRSETLPGLCLSDAMLMKGELRGHFELLQRSCDASAEHRQLLDRLNPPTA